jgi:hypothetical protein
MDPQRTPSARTTSREKRSPVATENSTSSTSRQQQNTPARLVVKPIPISEDRHERIQKRAYELHVLHGYPEGSALEDWLEAEREILGQTPQA